MDTSSVRPGINPHANLSAFSEEERRIINLFSKEWYITYGGEESSLGLSSRYKFFLMKPTHEYQELFNIKREIIVVFSEYEALQPRALDAFEDVFSRLSALRPERIATVLISRDKRIASELNALLRSDPERQIIVPFSYGELLVRQDDYFIKNRFTEHFFSRDLFDFRSALRRDFYFFARNDLVQDIVSRAKANENSGLFGLRKSGKTSIIFGVERVLQKEDIASVFIDCQSPGFHQKRWNEALGIIIRQLVDKYFASNKKIQDKFTPLDEYRDSVSRAADYFEKDLLTFNANFRKRHLLIIFDEIEHISPISAPTTHWIKENDFVYFWQTIRSVYQKHPGKMSYLISGTNPQCVELPQINGIDNPIFNQISTTYIPPFSCNQTMDMVDTLGRLMGLIFDETLFARLTDDFGGHPFLIRLVCSKIHSKCTIHRPARIDKSIYEQAKQQMLSESEQYIEMILNILKQYYDVEYEMLKMLALGNIAEFDEFSKSHPIFTEHLLAYQIIDKNENNFFFKMEAVKQFFVSKNKFEKKLATDEERYAEISERRNKIEKSLRSVVRQILLVAHGEVEAKKIVLKHINKKDIYLTYSLKALFNPNQTTIYFSDLKKIILSHWNDFEKIFSIDKSSFEHYMTTINNARVDCHAKSISEEEFNEFRIAMTKIEDELENFM